MKIYVASKIKHRQKWIDLRNLGYNIISKWIDIYDESKVNYISRVCIQDCVNSDLLLLHIDSEEEILKGAFIEFGMALATHSHIIVICNNINSKYHSNVFFYAQNVEIYSTLSDGINRIDEMIKENILKPNESKTVNRNENAEKFCDCGYNLMYMDDKGDMRCSRCNSLIDIVTST